MPLPASSMLRWNESVNMFTTILFSITSPQSKQIQISSQQLKPSRRFFELREELILNYAESTEVGRRTAGRSSATAPKAQARSHAGSSTRGRLAGRSSGRASLASSSTRSEWGRRSRRAECVPPFCELRGGVAHGDSTMAGQHTGGAESGGQGWRR
ncbi:hypothetical protein E2562_008660 [Oryza meyeriana var. granulata]|uniref:Uncharacterized protein n=1 Tax=Oryza meyeriana var. granulata TaxID=110450 RepID=A0A6G1F5D3_9ORYZ|nr:hypothetical protein E2562_008660 [Oryza meyeriana var. granulata]